jgi:NAD(P)-dependent dehydrogenase (short-subunit alcohol dehydrogenase family)
MTRRGRVAVVTGAARGIGRAIALRMLRDGSRVHGLDLEPIAPLAPGDHSLVAHVCDCSNESQVAATVRSIAEDGPVQVLVNSAGINPAGRPVTDTTAADWDRIMASNLRSTFLVSRAVIPLMTEGGSVVNIASILGLTGGSSSAAYTASKGAIIALTRAMARDHAPRIRVNCVCPGPVDTEMFEQYLSRTPDPDRRS